MNVSKETINESVYATALHVKGDYIDWKAKGYDWIMLIQNPYDKEFEIDDVFIDSLSKLKESELLYSDEGVNCNGSVIRMIPNGLMNSCEIPVRPASYAIYAVKKDKNTDSLCIYIPKNDENKCKVSTEIKILKNRFVPKKNIFSFFGVKDETPKYEITIQRVFPYKDGSIYYFFQGNDRVTYKYPVTNDMLGKTFTVNDRASMKLMFRSLNSGYQLTLKETEGGV